MGMDEVFAGVSFPDARIPVGSGTDTSSAPKDAGNAGTPAPATQVPGQQAGSPSATADQKAATSEGQGDKSDIKEKPLPYDQDPKWKKARAAEKALADVLDKYALLSVEELQERLERADSLNKQIGTRDPKKLLDDSDYADRVKKNWERQQREEKFKDEPVDARLQRIERENEELRKTYETYKTTVEEREHAQKVLEDYTKEVNRVLDVLEVPLPETEREMLSLILGVDNPANQIDIEDQVAVRKMTKDGVAKFQAAIQKIKQSAIDEYVSGKSKLAVDTSTGAPASVQQGVQRQPLPKGISPDEAFSSATKEFAEILFEGMKAAH